MVNTLQLKSKILVCGYTQRSLAKAMGVSKNTLNSKINGAVQFNIEDVDKICKILHIDSPEEKCAIFLHQSSQK